MLPYTVSWFDTKIHMNGSGCQMICWPYTFDIMFFVRPYIFALHNFFIDSNPLVSIFGSLLHELPDAQLRRRMIKSLRMRLVYDLNLTHIRSRDLLDHTGRHPFTQQIKTRQEIYWGWLSPGITIKRSQIMYTSGNNGHVYIRTAVRVVYGALAVDS